MYRRNIGVSIPGFPSVQRIRNILMENNCDLAQMSNRDIYKNYQAKKYQAALSLVGLALKNTKAISKGIIRW